MANEVTLTFVGDTDKLEKSFDSVGVGAKSMGDKVSEAGAGFDRVGEAADSVDTKAMGFRDTMTGVQDTSVGLGMIMKGELFTGFLTLGMGVGDLASGFYNLIIPMTKTIATTVASTAATVGHAAVSTAVAVKTAVWTAAQWLLNAALTANPIGIVVVAIAALIAIVVLIATKTTWFQDAWRVAWGAIKSVAVSFWDWMSALPGKIAGAFASIASAISSPFRAAFNAVANAWNNTVGRLSWTVPSWVPILGGHTISAPKLPTFHAGGRVRGMPGQDVVAILRAGEHVVTEKDASAAAVAGGVTNIYVTVPLEDLRQLRDLEEFLDLLRNNSRRGVVNA